MNHRKIALLAAAIVAFAPAASNASSEAAALDACAQAFATSLAAPGTAAPAYKVIHASSPNLGSVAEFYAREYTFYMRANDKKTGSAVARASCSTDTHGVVIALTPTWLDHDREALTAGY